MKVWSRWDRMGSRTQGEMLALCKGRSVLSSSEIKVEEGRQGREGKGVRILRWQG
jgi:hypothetical protein